MEKNKSDKPDKLIKFQELAEKRVNKAISTIRLVGNLSNINNYIYTVEQANRICSALDSEVRNMKAKFKSEMSKKSAKFKL